jgi:hypothetical protein
MALALGHHKRRMAAASALVTSSASPLTFPHQAAGVGQYRWHNISSTGWLSYLYISGGLISGISSVMSTSEDDIRGESWSEKYASGRLDAVHG